MNTYYLKKFRKEAEEYVYARLSEREGFAEIVYETLDGRTLWYSYGCTTEDPYMNNKGHFASYCVNCIDQYELTNEVRVKQLRERLVEARRLYIKKCVDKERFARDKIRYERQLKKINSGKRIEL
jgi:hypothetical protein